MGYAQLSGYVLAPESLYMELSFEKAQAVSMIVNELMVNAMKHGLKSRERGRISVRLVVGENQFLKNSFLSSYRYIFLISAIRLQIYTFS